MIQKRLGILYGVRCFGSKISPNNTLVWDGEIHPLERTPQPNEESTDAEVSLMKRGFSNLYPVSDGAKTTGRWRTGGVVHRNVSRHAESFTTE